MRWKLTVVLDYYETMETYSRIGLVQRYGNLQPYWTITKLWKLTVVLAYYEAMKTYSRIGLLKKLKKLKVELSLCSSIQELNLCGNNLGNQGVLSLISRGCKKARKLKVTYITIKFHLQYYFTFLSTIRP